MKNIISILIICLAVLITAPTVLSFKSQNSKNTSDLSFALDIIAKRSVMKKTSENGETICFSCSFAQITF